MKTENATATANADYSYRALQKIAKANRDLLPAGFRCNVKYDVLLCALLDVGVLKMETELPELEDLPELEELPELEAQQLEDLPLEDLPNLDELPGLEDLPLEELPLTDMPELEELPDPGIAAPSTLALYQPAPHSSPTPTPEMALLIMLPFIVLVLLVWGAWELTKRAWEWLTPSLPSAILGTALSSALAVVMNNITS